MVICCQLEPEPRHKLKQALPGSHRVTVLASPQLQGMRLHTNKRAASKVRLIGHVWPSQLQEHIGMS